MLKLQAMTRKNLIDIASASSASSSRHLIQICQDLKSMGIYGDATPDEIDEFDLALDHAEWQADQCRADQNHNWSYGYYHARCTACNKTIDTNQP